MLCCIAAVLYSGRKVTDQTACNVYSCAFYCSIIEPLRCRKLAKEVVRRFHLAQDHSGCVFSSKSKGQLWRVGDRVSLK